MADNVQLATMAGGDVCAADDIGGIKFQRVKATYGADGTATDVDETSGLPTSAARKEVAFTTTTVQAVASTEVRGYRWVSVHIVTQGGSSTVTFQGSNDNTNWVSVTLMTSTSTAGPAVASTTAAGVILHGSINFRYFRLNVTGIVSGTTAGVVEFFAAPGAFQGVGVTGIVDTELPTAVVTADNISNPTAPSVAAHTMLYNGAAWDRARTFLTAKDSSGASVLAVGLLGWDGSLHRAVKLTSGGDVYVREAAAGSATLANVNASVTSVTLLADQQSFRRGAVIYNDSTATLRVKFGSAASATSFTYLLVGGAHLELPLPCYSGIITGIWESATGVARVTEMTP